MASQFLEIILQRYLDEVLDNMNSDLQFEIENAKSEMTKTVLELGYKKCLDELSYKLKTNPILFCDRDYIHESDDGHIPYDSDELTPLSVYSPDDYIEPLTYASELPDEIVVKEIVYIKKNI